MTGINKGERAELKSIVRGQFKVLRSELDQREIEMHAEVEDQIADRYSGEDEKWSVPQHKVHESVMACNREINDALYEAGYQTKGSTERMWIGTPAMQQPPQAKRTDLRIHARTRIAAQVKAARLTLDRQEADLLRTLAVGALESDEAQNFLSQIPAVGDLVPAARLAELEATLDLDGGAA